MDLHYLRDKIFFFELCAENILCSFVKITYLLYDAYFLIVAIENGNI